MNPDYIKGVNLGNWLVLEKWMSPALFDGTTADDEYYLPTQLDPAVYEARIKTHRAEYINERDFATIRSWGLNSAHPRAVLHLRRPCTVDRLHRRTRQGLQLGREIRPDHPYRSAHRADEPERLRQRRHLRRVQVGAAARRSRIRAVRARTPLQAVRPSSGADGHRNHQRAEHHHLLADGERDRTLQGGRPGARRRHRPDRIRLAQGLLHHRLPPSARRRQGRAAGGQGRGVPRRLRHRTVEGLHARG